MVAGTTMTGSTLVDESNPDGSNFSKNVAIDESDSASSRLQVSALFTTKASNKMETYPLKQILTLRQDIILGEEHEVGAIILPQILVCAQDLSH